MPARRRSLSALAAAVAAALALALPALTARAADEAGCKDHPLVGRMPGYDIYRCDESREFDAFEFHEGPNKPVTVEGRLTKIGYTKQESRATPSALQIIRNYENALKSVGGKLLDKDDNQGWYRAARDGKEYWVYVSAYAPSNGYELVVVEKQEMAQAVTADAAAFASDIGATGHAAVYGILFDTGKAVLKPESDPALKQVAKLLADSPKLQLLVVGHTDNVGQLDANTKLSQQRAAAVVQALTTKHGVAAARLTPVGAGPIAPVAPNRDEEGRAKNRRVELVER